MNYETFRIDFFLSFPISLNSPYIHFDGILQMGKVIELKGDDTFIENNKTNNYTKLDLPLRYENNFYYCSAGIFDKSKRLVSTIYKNPKDLYHIWCSKKKAYLQNGNYRTFLINQSYLPISEITFFFETNDINKVIELVNKIPGIGKYVPEGFGWIKTYQISKIDGSAIIRDGITQRTLPADYISCNAEKLKIPCEPPYFLSGKKLCYLPFSEVTK
jgi:hypothetical protein